MRFVERFFRQSGRAGLFYPQLSMSLLLARKAATCFCWGLFLVIPAAVFGQTNYYTTNGMEYAIVVSLPGDQVRPDLAIGTNGGFVVWQDNATDGSGSGVSAQRLDSTLSGTLSSFPVNVTGTNDQEHARVALLKNGGAVFVWQGGLTGFQHIYARFLSPTNTWLTTTDVVVSVPTNNFQINPAVAVLNNSNVVVVWSSYNEAGANSMQDVYGQVFSPSGQKIGGEFLVNQFTELQPAHAGHRGAGQRRVCCRLGFGTAADAGAQSGKQLQLRHGRRNWSGPAWTFTRGFTTAAAGRQAMNFSSTRIPIPVRIPTWRPARTAGSRWSGARAISLCLQQLGHLRALVFRGGRGRRGGDGEHDSLMATNTRRSVSAIGTDYLVVWTSLGQDGSREGVFGQFLHAGGTPVGGEFRVNTTTAGPQMQPAVSFGRRQSICRGLDQLHRSSV